MAGEIKSVLNLDDTKFKSAIDRATSNLDTLDKNLKSAGKVAAEFEKKVGGLGSNLGAVADKFKMLDQTITSMVSRLTGITKEMDQIGSSASTAAKGVDRLGSAVKKAGSINADQWIKKYADSLDQLAPAIKNTVSQIMALDRANIESANTAKTTAEKSAQAKLKALEAERSGNAKIIAEREALAAELLTIEETMQKRADANAAVARNYRGANINHPNAQLYRQEAETAQIAARAAGDERAALQALIKEMQWRDQEIAKGIQLTKEQIAASEKAAGAAKDQAAAVREAAKAERDVALAAKQAAADAAKFARDSARERMQAAREAAAFERQQAEQISQMWKGMGQLWAASKIEGGVKKVVTETARGQQAELQLKSLNLPTAEFQQFKDKAFDLSQENKYLSFVDALQARLVALTSIGHNDVGIIDKTLGRAVTTAQALKAVGYEHGDVNDIVANLYGTAEMRQITNDPKAMQSNFDLMAKMGFASRGKLNIADFDTVMRNIGQSAGLISDEGILRIMGLMEQQKVAGHSSSSSSGAGVSSVGTMIKMAQLYAQGKPVSDNLLEQLVGAGIMNGEIDSAQSLKGGVSEHKAMLRAMKTAGFANSEEVMTDPVQALWKMRDPILEFMKGNAKNRALYFGNANADVDDEKAQMLAISKFWARSGLSNKAVTQNTLAMDPRYHKRSEDIAEMARGSLNGEDLLKEAAPNWDQAVSQFKKGASDLASAFDPFVKELSKVVDWTGRILAEAGKFARENPMIANVALITAGVIGLNLAFKGVINTFGLVSSFSNVFKTLASGATQAQTATAASTTAMAGFGQQATAVAASSLQAAMSRERVAEAARVHAIRELESAQALVASKTGFDRLRAVQETLIPAQQNAAKATAEHAAAHLAVGQAATGASIASRAMAGASKLLSGALSLVGGPLGLIAIALTVGVTLWENWGKAAETAAGKASKAADAALEKLQRLKDEEKYGSGDLGTERKTLEQLEETLGHKIAARASDVPEFRKKVENQQALVDELERRHYAAQQPPKVQTPNAGGGFGKGNPDFKLPQAQKTQREFEDLFAKTFQDLAARAKEAQLKIDAIVNGESTYGKQAEAVVFGKWAGGQFDKAKDPRNRGEFLKDGVRYDVKSEKYLDKDGKAVKAEDAVDWNKKGASGKSLSDMRAEEEAILRKEALLKSVSFATERYAATIDEADAASERFAKDGLAQESEAMRALKREFSREDARSNGVPKAKEEEGMSDEQIRDYRRQISLLNRARADSSVFAFDTTQKNKEAQANFLTDATGSVIEDADRIRQQHEQIIQKFKTQYQGLAAEIDAQLKATADKYGEDSDAYKKALNDKAAADAAYTEYLKSLEKQKAEALMTPLQKMAMEARKVYSQLDQLEAKWADGFMDQLGTVITGGKAQWRSYFSSIAADLSKMLMKKAFSELFADTIGGASLSKIAKGFFGGAGVEGGGLLAGWINKRNGYAADGMGPPVPPGMRGGADAAAGGAGAAANEAAKELGDTMKEAGSATEAATAATTAATSAKTAETSAVTASTTVTTTDTAAVEASTVAKTSDAMATEMDTAATVADAGATELSTVATITDTAAEWAEVTANEVSAATEYWADGGVAGPAGKLSFFAAGGAFTNGIYSNPTLFQFANGGQFGVMGEAGPEAVMPLSRDGKGRLGVTVNGVQGGSGGGTDSPIVNISIVVNSDGSTKTSTSGDAVADWKKMADRVKSVVREELVVQQRPGGVLYK